METSLFLYISGSHFKPCLMFVVTNNVKVRLRTLIKWLKKWHDAITAS
jgi:hypothetical protein